MSDDLHMPLRFGEAGPEIQRLREENQHIRGAYEDCRAQWTQMATHNAEQAAEITRLRASAAELKRLGKAIATERNQLIGVLQLAVEQSAETGENEPAWIGPACRILNAGFTKIAALEGKKDV